MLPGANILLVACGTHGPLSAFAAPVLKLWCSCYIENG